jgi:hypothetical protein
MGHVVGRAGSLWVPRVVLLFPVPQRAAVRTRDRRHQRLVASRAIRVSANECSGAGPSRCTPAAARLATTHFPCSGPRLRVQGKGRRRGPRQRHPAHFGHVVRGESKGGLSLRLLRGHAVEPLSLCRIDCQETVLILDSPPHVATIFVEETVSDTYSNVIKRPSTTGVEVACLITPQSSRRDTSRDSRTHDTFPFIARDAPIGTWSRVQWNGHTFSVDAVERHNASPATAHVSAILRLES